MQFFLLKKQTNLLFISKEYSPDEIVPNSSQVRFYGGRSKSKLVKCSDGEWYIKTGPEMLRLKSVHAKEMTLAVLNENGGEFKGKVDCKWFLEKRQAQS